MDNQSHASFWCRIHEYYEKNKKIESRRMDILILHRWMHILEQENKYCGCYEAIEHMNQGGSTIQDKVSVIDLFCLPIWFICKDIHIDI